MLTGTEILTRLALFADVPWALSYLLVALAIALGLAVVVRPSRRKAD